MALLEVYLPHAGDQAVNQTVSCIVIGRFLNMCLPWHLKAIGDQNAGKGLNLRDMGFGSKALCGTSGHPSSCV